MKRLKVVLGILVALVCVFTLLGSSVGTSAAESDYYIKGYVVNSDLYYTISVGDKLTYFVDVYTTIGDQTVKATNWDYYEIDKMKDYVATINDGNRNLFFYSASEDPNSGERVWFDEEQGVTEEMFGKYIYAVVGIYTEEKNGYETHLTMVRSNSCVCSAKDTNGLRFKAVDGESVKVFSIDDKEKVEIPSVVELYGNTYDVIAIDMYAAISFDGYDNKLKAIFLPSNVTHIGQSAFEGTSSLKTIRIEGKLNYVGENAFKGINKNATISIKGTREEYINMLTLIVKSGISRTVKYKRIK